MDWLRDWLLVGALLLAVYGITWAVDRLYAAILDWFDTL